MLIFRKICACVLMLSLLAGLLCGCGSAPALAEQEEGKLRIVTTIFPEYDWVRQVLGERAGRAELTLLLDNGVDLHSYQPTADDMVTLASCDLFLYVGGESDEWVEDALKGAVNPDMIALNLLELLGDAVREEELVEGMEADHDHDHEDEDEDHDHEDEDHEDEEGPEYDEHVWLSLRNAAVLVRAIAEALGRLDPEGAETYAANAEIYCAALAGLDADYAAAVEAGAQKALLFGDRFPFRYLTEDYGLDYYAAFVGCSAETEASFETVLFLANKLDELDLGTVLVIDGGNGKLARTIVETSEKQDAQVLALDSLQSVTSKDVENGATYLGAMEQNLNVLKQALG